MPGDGPSEEGCPVRIDDGGPSVATATSKTEIEAIRRQMAQIRRELHEDVQGVVVGAEAVTDWRHYFRQYPWAALAGAVAIGYLIVPKKKRGKADDEAENRPAPLRSSAKRAGVSEVKVDKQERKAGLLGTLFGMVTPVAMRAAQGYASQYLENWIAQQGVLGPQPGAPPQEPPPPKQSQSPPRPGGPPRGGMPSGPGMPSSPRRP